MQHKIDYSRLMQYLEEELKTLKEPANESCEEE
jgi:hypothetical protein